jgi:hypothetical protein
MGNWYGDVINMLVKYVYFWPGWRVRVADVQDHVLKTRFTMVTVCLSSVLSDRSLFILPTPCICVFSTMVTNQRLQN